MIKPHSITKEFEEALAQYTGSPYCVTVDNCSNALFLALSYSGIQNQEFTIPNRTYMSFPCAIIHAGGRVKFDTVEGNSISGPYALKPTRVIDSALRFTAD